MTDTTINAVVFPQDEGTGVSDGNEDYISGSFLSALSRYKGDGTYVGEDETGSATLQFANIDTSNNTVDIQTGYSYISVSSQKVQSGSQTSFDTTIPVGVPYVVVIPSSVTGLGLDGSSVNDLFLAIDESSNETVYIRHGSSVSTPSDPYVKLGTVDTSDSSTTRPNDLSNPTQNSVTTSKIEALGSGGVAITGGDLTDGTNVIYDATNSEIPDSAMGSISNSTLSNDSVTIEGNSVSLGGSTSINHNDLSTISSDDHHSKYTDSEASAAAPVQDVEGKTGNVTLALSDVTTDANDIYITQEGATDPTTTDGDIWFEY